MNAVAENWLALEPLLVARLKAEVPELRAVYLAADIAALDVQQDPRDAATPAAHVMYLGDQVGAGSAASAGSGEVQMVDQVWCVALVVRNARGAEAVRADMGPLLSRVIKSLAGWAPDLPGMRPLKRSSARTAPRFDGKGKAIFPLFFSARVFA